MEPETIHDRMLVAAGRLHLREVAALTGIHPETVRRYLGGDMPSCEFIASFCGGLGISADWLVLGTPPMTVTDSLRAALQSVAEADLFAAVGASLAALEVQTAGGQADEAEGGARPSGLRRPGGASGPADPDQN